MARFVCHRSDGRASGLPMKKGRLGDPFHLNGENFGRGGGIRTRDPLLPKQMRYQAALRPEQPGL
ncbi:MAG: hypothetical protein RL500_450 [Pseudomonadota bacterium]